MSLENRDREKNNRRYWVGALITSGIVVVFLLVCISGWLFLERQRLLPVQTPMPVVITVTPRPTEVPSETPQPRPTDTPVVIVVSATPESSDTPLPLPTNTLVPPTSTSTGVPPRHYGEIEHYWPPKELTIPALADGKVYEKANNQSQVLWEIGRFPQETHPYANALVWGLTGGNWTTYFELLNRDEQGRWVVQGYLLSSFAFTPTPIPTAIVPSVTPSVTPSPVATLIPWSVDFIYEAQSRGPTDDYQVYLAKVLRYTNIPSNSVVFAGETRIETLLCSQRPYQVSFAYYGPIYENKIVTLSDVLKPDCPKYYYVFDDFSGKSKPQLVVSADQANLRTAGFVTPETLYKTVGRSTVFNPNDVIALVISENYHGNPYWWLVRNIFVYPWEEPKELLLHSSLVYPPVPALTPGPTLTPVVSLTPSPSATPTVTGTPVPQARFELVNEEIVVSPDQEERIVIKNTGNKLGDFTGHQLVTIRFEDDKPILHYYRFPDEVDGRFMIVEPGKTITLYVQRQGVDSFLPEKGFVLYWKVAPDEKVFLDDVRGAIWLFKLKLTLPPEWNYLVDCYAYGRVFDYKCP